MATQQFNALKQINTLQRDGSLQNLLLSIKKAKSDIDAFSKSLGDRRNKLQVLKREEERKQAEKVSVIETVEVEKPVVEKETPKEEKKQIFSQGNSQNNNFRKFDGQNVRQNKNFGGQNRQFGANNQNNGQNNNN